MSSASTDLHGAKANAGHVSLQQLKVMSAIESCRTAALGGHVARCEDCAHVLIAYNSCVMGKFRNGELTSDFIELSVNFRDFASPLRIASERSAQRALDQRVLRADAMER